MEVNHQTQDVFKAENEIQEEQEGGMVSRPIANIFNYSQSLCKQENPQVAQSQSKDELEENFGGYNDTQQSSEGEVTIDSLPVLETDKHSRQGEVVKCYCTQTVVLEMRRRG